jgi:hypothetical protein
MMVHESWWRSNAVALVALALVLPATAAVPTVNEWWDYYSGRPAQAVDVEPGAVTSFADAIWSDVRLTSRSDRPDLDIPPGTKLLVATIDVDIEPSDPPPGCTLTVREATGAQRRWSSASSDLSAWRTSEGMASSCSSEAMEPYTVEVPFVLPDDSRGPYTIDMSVGEELPRFLRFRFDD